MYNYVLFWISYLLFRLRLISFLKRLFRDTPSRACKTRSGGAKPITPPYVENNYRIEVKITFILTAYLVLLCEFLGEFSIFHFCRPLVDIYWHPLLSLCYLKHTKFYLRHKASFIQISTTASFNSFLIAWLWGYCTFSDSSVVSLKSSPWPKYTECETIFPPKIMFYY